MKLTGFSSKADNQEKGRSISKKLAQRTHRRDERNHSKKKVKAFVDKRQASKGEPQLGQITDSLAYKVPGDVAGGLEGMIRLEEYQLREVFVWFFGST